MTYDLINMFVDVDLRLSDNPHLRLYELAKEFGVSCRTIETAIRLGCGKTYRQLKNQKRLAKAQILLEQAGLSRKEIAALVGFRSAEAFARFVKSCTGKSPSRLKRAAQSG